MVDDPASAAIVDDDRALRTHCGSGVSACVVVLAVAAAGRDEVRLHPGSWGEWPARWLPIARGDEPAAR